VGEREIQSGRLRGTGPAGTERPFFFYETKSLSLFQIPPAALKNAQCQDRLQPKRDAKPRFVTKNYFLTCIL
jgi:hypothetical protein